MRKVAVGLLGLSLTATGLVAGTSASAAPQPQARTTAPSVAEPAQVDHDLPNPLEEKRRALRQEGLSEVLSGEAKAQNINGSRVVKVGKSAAGAAGAVGANVRSAGAAKGQKDQYVELQREKSDRIFVILAEFGNERHPSYPDKDIDPTTPGPTRFDGPLHNQIDEPNRAVDNSTVWQPDYAQEHYRQLYFGTEQGDESLKQYYEAQSSGRYTVDGEVTDWVKVKYNEARYGRPTATRRSRRHLPEHLGAGPGRREPVGRRPEGQGPHRRRDHGGREALRPVGPLRLRRRRRLQRARRLHRPLPDRPRRRRPGRRRPVQGEDAIWSHRWYAYATDPGRPARTQPARRHPDRRHRHLDRRLHRAAGERRPQRLRPRVRP